MWPFFRNLSGTTQDSFSHRPPRHGPTSARVPDPQPHPHGARGRWATSELERRWPTPSPRPPLFPRLNQTASPRHPERCLPTTGGARLGRNPPLQPGARGPPPKVTEQGRTPLPPRGMLGKEAPPREDSAPREAPPPRSAPYGGGGPARPPLPRGPARRPGARGETAAAAASLRLPSPVVTEIRNRTP